MMVVLLERLHIKAKMEAMVNLTRAVVEVEPQLQEVTE
jgi:hypothetical protein